MPIDQQTVASVAQDTYSTILKVDGFKEAAAYYEWHHFWTVAYQQQWRADAIEGIGRLNFLRITDSGDSSPANVVKKTTAAINTTTA